MKKQNKKAQAVLYVFFIITAIIIVTIAAVLAPMGVLFNTKMYAAGEAILEDAQPDIDNINDANIRAAVNSSVAAAKQAGSTSITVNSSIFQYSWILILLITGLVVFLQARRLIEVGAGGFI